MPDGLNAVSRTIRLGLGAILLSGCSLFLPETKTPIPALHYDNSPSAETLIVLLPGRGEGPEGYAERGFVTQLKQCDRPLTIAAVDAHLGYYAKETIAIRLTEDIIQPALERGVKHVWLVGISLGGLGSLIHLNDYPGVADGAVLIAPFLGENDVIEQLPQPLSESHLPQKPPDDAILDLWHRSVRLLNGDSPPEIYLAYGTEDRFADAHRRFTELLDPEHIFTTAGPHRWETWQILWNKMLPGLPFCPFATETTE